jgi:hypothetical protein
MKSKIIFLLCFVMTLLFMANGQLALRYDYDAAGNRVLRKTIYLEPQWLLTPSDSTVTAPLTSEDFPPLTSNLSSLTADYLVEKIAQVEIKIYPNPATEKIILEFSGIVETHGRASLRLYTLSGQLLQEQPIHSATTEVSLAELAQGAYILKVQINGITG